MFLAFLSLSACTTVMTPHERQQGLERAEWAIVGADEAWMNMPDASIVLERRFAEIVEQRVSLPNHTTMSGDNFAYLRAVPQSDGHIFELDRVIAQAGGLPAPFTDEEIRVMRSTQDAAGALNWTEWTDGAGNTCVLALRRLTPAVRIVPTGARAIDLMLRNCSADGVEAALRPAGPAAVALPAPHGTGRGGEILTMSPLAAPMP